MPYIQVRNDGSERIDLYFEDHGSGPPVVLVHGWPLASGCWEKQVQALIEAGYRVVYYDRRGFGGSSRPASGYGYDALAADLDTVMTALELRDVALIGFSMGTGECVRYLSRFGSERVRAIVFVASFMPSLVRSPDNTAGIDLTVFDEMVLDIELDRYAFASRLLRDYYNVELLLGNRISDEAVHASWNVVALVSEKALADGARALTADFRADLSNVSVPALVLHGDDDCILPITATSLRLHHALPQSRFVVIEGGPHGILWTHATEVNRQLIRFLKLHMQTAVR
jgi:non-heme chloroperoxidase